jgi:hypothetical protein
MENTEKHYAGIESYFYLTRFPLVKYMNKTDDMNGIVASFKNILRL